MFGLDTFSIIVHIICSENSVKTTTLGLILHLSVDLKAIIAAVWFKSLIILAQISFLLGWQTRWFVLEDDILSYYMSQEEVNQGCKGSIKVSALEIMGKSMGNC